MHSTNNQNQIYTDHHRNEIIDKYQPISIKRQLELIKQKKNKQKQSSLPVVQQYNQSINRTNSSIIPQLNYLKKIKLKIKSKKTDKNDKNKMIIYHHEKFGLKELFRFYCLLHSDVHHKKGDKTFEEMEKNNNLLYMHNFMLFCKDFNLIEPHLPLKLVNKQNLIKCKQKKVKQNKQNINSSNNNNNVNSKVSKAALDNNKQNVKNKHQKVKEKQIKKQNQQYQLWDRDSINNLFKKQADYNLNVKYLQFVKILCKITKNKFIIKQKVSQNHDKKQQQHQYQKDNQKVNDEDEMINLCKCLNIDTEEKYKQTIKRIKSLYKVYQPPSKPQSLTKSSSKSPVIWSRLDGFQQTFKEKQKQKQYQNLQVKMKYLRKYQDQNINPYSQFKSANNSITQPNGHFLKKISEQNNQNSYLKKHYNQKTLRMGKLVQETKNYQQNELNQNQFLINKIKSSKSSYFNDSRLPSIKPKQKLQSPLSEFEVAAIIGNKSNEKYNIQSQNESNSKNFKNLKSQRTKSKSKNKDTNSPLLKIIGCDEEDELLNKFFDKEKNIESLNLKKSRKNK